MMNILDPLGRWDGFLGAMDALVDRHLSDTDTIAFGTDILASLVAVDDWLPDSLAAPDSRHYQQHLLHLDPRARFSVVSFVWAPGQSTPIHDHGIWGLVGMLRGSELSQRFVHSGARPPQPVGAPRRLEPGDVECLDPAAGDIHKVSNASDGVSVSIHVYGADIGKVERRAFGLDGDVRRFISGYSAGEAPQHWTGNRP